MEGIWLISYLVLWAVVFALAVAVLAHSRLLGLLHHRVAPALARPLADGPAVGTSLASLDAQWLDQSLWRWTFPGETDLLLIFLSPQCRTCNELLPHVQDFARAYGHDVTVLMVSTMADPGMNQAYASYRSLDTSRYLVGAALSEQLQVEATPYALLMDREGTVRAKGIVNHFEHLRSMLTAQPGGAPAAARQTPLQERPQEAS